VTHVSVEQEIFGEKMQLRFESWFDSRLISAKSLGTWIFLGSRFYKLMGLRYNPKLSIWKLKIVHHWDVSTKSMLERLWFFGWSSDSDFGSTPVYELQSIHSAKKRKPDETVDLQHSKQVSSTKIDGCSKIAKGFRGSLWVFCRESFSTTPSGSSLFKLYTLGSIYITNATGMMWLRNPRFSPPVTRG